jgi:RNA 2',3'-cyclic 3'-phosphodiesterase
VRCFVASWPDTDVRTRLDEIAHDVRQRLGTGRRVPAANLHMTLAFIGELESTRAIEVAADLAASDFAAFDWQVDHVGHFARARVVWAGGPLTDALVAVAAGVRARLDRLGIAYDPKPFVPHVTLLRDANGGRAADGPLARPVTWPVSRPVLLSTGFVGGRPGYRPVA